MVRHLPKWIRASIAKHFQEGLKDIHLMLEGAPRQTNELTNWVELRVDGPYATKMSPTLWDYYMEINTLIMDKMDERDMYRIEKTKGILLELHTVIPVFKFGNGVDDTGAFVGCLMPFFGKRDKIEVADFGILDVDTRIRVAQVEGHYILEVDTSKITDNTHIINNKLILKNN